MAAAMDMPVRLRPSATSWNKGGVSLLEVRLLIVDRVDKAKECSWYA